MHLTPTISSWLNQVERFFALLTDKKIRRGVYRSVAALRADITSFIERHNADPKPFRWTKSADDILCFHRMLLPLQCPGTIRGDVANFWFRILDLNLDIAPGEFLIMLGPSCSGRLQPSCCSPASRCRPGALLERCPIDKLPPHTRDIGMVFQNYALVAYDREAEPRLPA